jgi:transcriptional regulator with XRE-family HTH domain
MTLDWHAFGKDVHRKRLGQCETVREVAADVGLCHATFSRAERGQVVSAETFLLLCVKFLKCDPRNYYQRDSKHG